MIARALVFDAYGTLFDFASATAACKDVIGEQTAALTALFRDTQLRYTWLRSLQGRHEDFAKVTGDALDYAMESLAITDTAVRERVLGAYRTLDAFSDVRGALEALKARGMPIAILSNGSPDLLATAVKASHLGPFFDYVLSVEEVGVFKPHPRVYQLAVDRLGVPVSSIVFVSSNAWDAWAASAFGMQVVWCNRYAQRGERLPGAPDHEIRTLADLPPLLDGA